MIQNTGKISSQTGHIFTLQLNGPININQMRLFRINANEKKKLKYVFKWNVPQHSSQTGLGDVSPSQTSRRLRKTRELVVTPALSTGAITEHLPMVKPELRTAKYSQSIGWNFPRTGTLLRMIHLISTTCRNSDHLVWSDLTITVQRAGRLIPSGNFLPQTICNLSKNSPVNWIVPGKEVE